MNASARASSPVAAATAPIVESLAGPRPVDDYVAYALSQNPDIQAARKRVDAAGQRVPQAASLQDPVVGATGYPFFPNVPQTASGRMTAGLGVSQAVPWFGKLRTKAAIAETHTDVNRALLAAEELRVVEEVKRAYYELYFIQKATSTTTAQRGLLVDLTRIAESKYRAGQVSFQDVLRSQVEILNVDNQLIRLRQELASAQAGLARLLHVSPDTSLAALNQLPDEQLPRDLQRLYEQAIRVRPELQAQLAAIQRDRRTVELARLQYYPDVNLSFAWSEITTNRAISGVANGNDNLGVGLAVNVPIYRKRLDAGVREAEAQAVASARGYDSLRDQTQQSVKDLFVQTTAQRDLVQLFSREIVPKADQTLKASFPAYEAGQTDLLQLINNWRDLLQFQIAYYRLQSQLRQTIATLERVVGGELPVEPRPEQLPGQYEGPAPPGNELPVPNRQLPRSNPANPPQPPTPSTRRENDAGPVSNRPFMRDME
jgi:outer membrane protein, heavy metal efflux system